MTGSKEKKNKASRAQIRSDNVNDLNGHNVLMLAFSLRAPCYLQVSAQITISSEGPPLLCLYYITLFITFIAHTIAIQLFFVVQILHQNLSSIKSFCSLLPSILFGTPGIQYVLYKSISAFGLQGDYRENCDNFVVLAEGSHPCFLQQFQKAQSIRHVQCCQKGNVKLLQHSDRQTVLNMTKSTPYCG